MLMKSYPKGTAVIIPEKFKKSMGLERKIFKIRKFIVRIIRVVQIARLRAVCAGRRTCPAGAFVFP